MINYLAVLAAAVAAWVLGAIWYGLLGKAWLKALGPVQAATIREKTQGKMPLGPMIVSFVAELIMALMLSGLLRDLGPVTVIHGAMAGGLIWLGFVVTTILVNNAYQSRTMMLSVLDSLHWLAVLIVQGVVIGLFG
jgi:hypothetical protein